MLRWRLLATGWRSIEEFDLILSAESQFKVLRLLWIGGRSKPGFPFISRTQFICLLWLLISIVATILPALLGLTYSIDISNTYVKKNWGLITIADLSLIGHQNTDGPVTINTQQAAAQAYGIEGENYVIIDDTDPSDQIYYNAIYTDDMVDFFIVRFFDYNPENSLLSAESSRYLTTNATCESYNIITDANTNGTTLTYIDGDGSQANEYIEEYVPGLTTYILDTLHPCGERCASLLVYQAANNDTVDVSSFYKCNNSVSAVYGAPSWNASVYALPDVQAQIWAGAIGSTGFEVNGDQRQYQVYSGNTQFSTLGPLDYYSAQIAISGFTAYGLAAYNQNGVRQNVTGYTPNTALQLDVEWKWALTVLAIIPFLHFLAYVAVIAWANKAIIKDDSHLSTAKLLQPIVERLGNGGCILTGDDIVKRDEFKDSRVAYGFTDMGGEGENKVMHLGVIFEHPQEGYRPVIERAWPDGRYNGPDDEKFRKRSRRMSL
ncbi:hypothetical protein UCRPC4_g04202 [Phaeomoniella chlamydospora]|uniref:Uncharacterized protein n=1 Tax=Phaeomoniella chlamydospora TaxID=158046 RepID=A0A0G2EBG8_PHACM|nr:hypothetical protein UCRPC4_g04202 [Phaeomoniella chlamydospora]